jgi:DNA-binding sugar fermentation-stimulating protein
MKTLNNIKRKKTEHKLIIAQADKGKTLVIIHDHEHNRIVNELIQANQFTHITEYPSNHLQHSIKQSVKQSPEHIPKNQQWKYYNI